MAFHYGRGLGRVVLRASLTGVYNLGKHTSEKEKEKFTKENVRMVSTLNCSCVRFEPRADHSQSVFIRVIKCFKKQQNEWPWVVYGLHINSHGVMWSQPQNEDKSCTDRWESSLCGPLHYSMSSFTSAKWTAKCRRTDQKNSEIYSMLWKEIWINDIPNEACFCLYFLAI